MEKSHQFAKHKIVSFAIAAVLAVGAFSANTAFACGFIACVAEAVDPGHADVYRALDKANGDYGHPVEAAGYAVLQSL
ncbi:hypothetical protein [Caballeronia sp. ATUFL_F1_KS4A]|uniref:hypothetical protein n=1 Tax=Caballeronia sp. ATUFL_F1_KS4A TaxID=2921768 RepID=UPI0020292B5D|nr:hypothetical protein [Caballeronia sp. ATUFL_F1_KS4A]